MTDCKTLCMVSITGHLLSGSHFLASVVKSPSLKVFKHTLKTHLFHLANDSRLS